MINITTRKIGGNVIATLIRGDNATTAIRFNVPERTDGVDLSGLSWAVLIRNAAGGTDVYVPALAERDGHFVTFDWFPGGVATAAAGLTEVMISGTAQADNPPVWQSATYYVRVDEKVDADPAGDDAVQLTELQRLIVFVSGELNGVIDAGRAAREAANRANEAAERAESIAGVAIDGTLTQPGAAADAAVVGEKFNKLSEEKVDKAQGADNALKLLFVADDGNVSALTAESGVEVQMRGDETDESIIVNLWKPDNYELGSFSNSGNKYAGDGTAMRSAEWIEVTPGAEYSAYFIKQPQLGMSLFFYDADGNFLEKKWAGGTLYHFTATGIKYVNFVISSWYAKHPDDGVLPQMMLWRTTSTDLPTEYVEYGRYDKPRLLAPGVARNAADILAVRRAAFDGQFLNIAYSTIHKGIINSTEHFMTASKLGFNTLKCDVQPTSDGELVLCHDAGYTFDDNGRILQTMDEGNNTKIITMTAAEVAALEFAGAQDAQDYYSHPCFLEDFVRICKERGKVAFITIRNDHIPDVVAPKLLEIVQKYGMVSRTIVNSFNIESLKAVRRLNNEICLHQVGVKDQVLTTARVDQINDLGNAMFGLYMHPAGTGSTVLADSAAAIEYAHRKGVRVLGAASSTYAEYNECIVSGLAGTQINSAILPYNRELLTFSVAVSGGVAAFTNTGAAERYTGEAVLSSDEITVRNIKLQGSTRDFPDGILPIWMKYLPHRMEIVSTSGQTCNVTYSNHAWHITAANITADDTYKVYIEI